jgi:hypothetical protein
MSNRYAKRKIMRGTGLAAALAVILAGCAQSGVGSGSTSRYSAPDPYHYRCTGNCQAGG